MIGLHQPENFCFSSSILAWCLLTALFVIFPGFKAEAQHRDPVYIPAIELSSLTDTFVRQMVDSLVHVHVYCTSEKNKAGYTLSTGNGVLTSEKSVLTVAHIFNCESPSLILVTTLGSDVIQSKLTRIDQKIDLARLASLNGNNFVEKMRPEQYAGAWDGSQTAFICIPIEHESINCAERLTENLIDITLENGTSGSGVFYDGMLVGLISTYYPLRKVIDIALIPLAWRKD